MNKVWLHTTAQTGLWLEHELGRVDPEEQAVLEKNRRRDPGARTVIADCCWRWGTGIQTEHFLGVGKAVRLPLELGVTEIQKDVSWGRR